MADVHDRNDRYENHLSDTDSDSLDKLKRQMELRGAELGKTWSDLSRIMSLYQNQLIQKHESYKSSLNTDELTRISKIEALVERKSLQIQKLEKANSDLESRLLEKDSEIVRLRTEVHQCRNEVSMKDSLIEKLQTQMAKEAIEYQTELNSLREMLQMNSCSTGSEVPQPVETGAIKRRRLAPLVAKQSSIKQEASLQSSLRQTQSAFTSQQENITTPETVLELDAFGNPDLGEEGYYKLDDVVVGDESLQSDDFKRADDADQGILLDSGQDLSQNRDQSSMTDMTKASIVPSQLLTMTSLASMTSQRGRPPASASRDQLASFSIMEKMRSALCRCNVCGKGFPSKWALDRHMKTHSGIRPYKCVVCEARFTEKYNATVHVMNVHRKGPDQAKDCVIGVKDDK